MSGGILIQGAMEVETDWLVSRMEEPVLFQRGGFPFWAGRIGELELAVSQTGIGTVCAACATTLGIEKFRPQVVINQGLAGAHREDLHVGDIIVGRSCVHIHDLKTPARGRGEGSDPFSWAFHHHQDGEKVSVWESDPQWADLFERAAYSGGEKVPGRLGSGDIYNREADRILWLREQGGQLCEDMESVAAYQVCRRLSVPCVGLRIISNNELTGEPYQRTVGEILQRFVLEALLAGVPVG